jgi:hypothetical protein
MQNASPHPVTPALLSARSAFRVGPAGDRFHNRNDDAGGTRGAPPALKFNGQPPLVLSHTSERLARVGLTVAFVFSPP